MALPALIKPIPAQIVNELAAYGPFDLKEFIELAEGVTLPRFTAGLADGRSLPKGLICTQDGVLTGIPAKGTEGVHTILVTITNEDGAIDVHFEFTIKPSLVGENGDLYNGPVSVLDVYYLAERWATLAIWDIENLEHVSKKILLTLAGASEHYHVYDRGSCLVATPKDLFSHERTTEDALMTARAMAGEVYKRGWAVELAGFEKMERAAWVELQHLEDKHGRKCQVVHYEPSFKDLRIYTEEAKEYALKRSEQQP